MSLLTLSLSPVSLLVSLYCEPYHLCVSSLHIINPPTPKSMDFYDFTSKWIMQIVQNCISDVAVWRSFTGAVIFYLNIGDLGLHFCGFNYVFVLYIYNGIFTHISSPLSLCKRFQYFFCFAITIVTL
ncbi:hypothetical protein AMTRI_Chr12g237180 [Amborella trichopoda]